MKIFSKAVTIIIIAIISFIITVQQYADLLHSNFGLDPENSKFLEYTFIVIILSVSVAIALFIHNYVTKDKEFLLKKQIYLEESLSGAREIILRYLIIPVILFAVIVFFPLIIRIFSPEGINGLLASTISELFYAIIVFSFISLNFVVSLIALPFAIGYSLPLLIKMRFERKKS